MLVEDDNNLREIYQARLSSEGYDTVTASDGEEALSIVGREKPDLIILDVMMPKISGFDTLDLLKNNPLTRDIKVIMMTALSQAEDRARAQKLGAQNYLVKSQVTLEDIVKAIKDALNGTDVYPGTESADAAPAESSTPEAPVASVFNTTAPVEETPVAPAEAPVASSEPIMQPPADLTASMPDASSTPATDSSSSMFSSPTPAMPDATVAPAPETSSEPIMQPPPDLTASMPETTSMPMPSEAPMPTDGSASTNHQF